MKQLLEIPSHINVSLHYLVKYKYQETTDGDKLKQKSRLTINFN